MTNCPLSEYLIAILSMQWPKWESQASARIPNEIRSRVDVSQIVNDTLYEWIQAVSKHENEGSRTQVVEESIVALLAHILQKRTGDAIRKAMAWKRGGRAIHEAGDLLVHHEELRNTGISDLEHQETMGKFALHLDQIQLSVLSLRYEGHTELEIAQELRIPVETVRQARKAIARIAHEVLSDRKPSSSKNQEPRTKNQEPRKNKFEKWKDSGCMTFRLRLVQ